MKIPFRVAVILVFLLVFVAGPSLVTFYTDWLWFGELGYQSVYTTILGTQALLFAVVFLLAFGWLVLNVRVALNSIREFRPVFVTREGIEVALPGRKQLRTLGSAVAALVAAAVALYGANQWEVLQAWLRAQPFGQSDPILGHDVGFYVFSLPFLTLLKGLGQTLVVLAAVASGGIYLLSGSLSSRFPVAFSISAGARRHLSALGVVFLLLLAFGEWLHRAEYLVQASGVIHGASYADVHGRMPASLLLIAVCLAGAALIAYQAYVFKTWPIIATVALYFAVAIGGEIYSSALQRFVVTPNEQARETPFIEHNIQATRRAYSLDQVDERELSGDALLTREDIERNAPTLDNVRLWDHQPLLETFGQIQEIRTYYDFVSVDNDRYRLDGSPRQVMLSARELNSASLPNRTWVNERLIFTHGYGLTLGPVNEVTSEGLPVLFVQNLPPETTPPLQIDEPSLYYGELSNDYVIARTNAREFHYPRGDDNEFTRYDGSGGVELSSLWRKLLFALRFGSYQILLSDDIQPDSRIMFARNISDRVQRLAPFLTFDRDPYLVLADGRLVWIYDAYTTTSLYPYSTPTGGQLNYIRNSVKFVIDAYHGTTTAYLADESDPIVQTYARIFPSLFTPLAEMPASIREHVRYPEDIFAVQASVYATYHMTQPSVFYNREDQWEVPTIDRDGESQPMQPYYTIMRLPGESEAEFIQMLPFNPRRRDNLAAWLVARSDGEHYGRLGAFEFPKQKLIFGPRQVVGRINQDQTIAPQITLWNQQGSQVIWGTLMVIPIEESLIYVRPLYLRGAGGRIPELRRVVVAYNNQIVMEQTLDAAMDRLFADGPAAPPAIDSGQEQDASAPLARPPSAAAAEGASRLTALGDEASAHYERAIEAQRSGDWAKYGEEIRLLGEVLERMRAGGGS